MENHMWIQICAMSPYKGVSNWQQAWPNRDSLATEVGQQLWQKNEWTTPILLVHSELGLRIAAKPWLLLYSAFLVPDVWSQMQHFPANTVQVDKTVAEPESLKKLLIIWLMCIRLWECEINHQPWDELLKWILVFRLLSLGNGFSFLHHQVNRCRDAVFSFSQSQ